MGSKRYIDPCRELESDRQSRKARAAPLEGWLSQTNKQTITVTVNQFSISLFYLRPLMILSLSFFSLSLTPLTFFYLV